MNIYEPRPGMYQYKYLPRFAGYLLDHHLDEFVREQLNLSRAMKLPLLSHLGHLSDEQLMDFSRKSFAEYLQSLAANQAADQLRSSMKRWKNDELNIIGKFNIGAEDVTLVNYIREKLFKKWIREYDLPADQKFELIDEIDTFFFGATTSATNLYIDLLKNKVEEESHFNRKLISTSPGIIFIFDLNKNKEVFISGNIIDVLGYSKEEILQMERDMLSILTHPDDRSALKEHLGKIANDTEGKTHQFEYRFRHSNGEYKWLRTYGVIFKRDDSGHAIEIMGTTFEITNEKHTALALEKRETQLLEAQAIAHLGSFEWNMTTDVSVNTPELTRIFELTEAQKLNDFLEHVHPDDRQKVEATLEQSIVSGTFDCQYRYSAGQREKVLWTRGVVFIDQNQHSIMRGTVQDITTLKQIESELLKKSKELEKSNEHLRQFASIASHDLKEPLRKVSMFTDIVLTMEGGKLTEHSHINLQKVKTSAIRMQNMIEDILNLSTITDTGTSIPVPLKTLVDEVKEILEDSIIEKDVLITCDNLPAVEVVPAQIRQVFQNLISNAIKFSRPGVRPEISIRHRVLSPSELQNPDLAPAPEYVQVDVQDNGIGFKQEFADKIFGLFTRLHSRAAYDGTGLGLSICKRIIENHGGSIWARSTTGAGAVFSFVLPRRDKGSPADQVNLTPS